MKYFLSRKNEPLVWYNKSSDLHASAGALWLSMQDDYSSIFSNRLELGDQFRMSIAVRPVYLMLCGLSLELIYKAIVIARGATPPVSHDLINLANIAQIKINNKAKKILSALTQSIVWEGKYPVPKDIYQDDYFKTHRLYYELMLSANHLSGDKGKEAIDLLGWDSYNSIWRESEKYFFENYN
jgi:hypothetical protein